MTLPSRPRVICHMMSSIDGRIVVGRWPDIGDLRQEYERIAATFKADAWMCGRITMEPCARGSRSDEAIERERSAPRHNRAERSDFASPSGRASYAVAVDA